MSFVKTILCPVDFSEGSERAVDHAALVAKATGASVELLHVYRLPTLALPEGEVIATPDFVTKLTEQALTALEKYRETLTAQGVSASTRIIEGDPATTILHRAQEMAASMLVLGTHGRSGFKRFMLGSTTERVVRQSSIPVLSVHLTE